MSSNAVLCLEVLAAMTALATFLCFCGRRKFVQNGVCRDQILAGMVADEVPTILLVRHFCNMMYKQARASS